MNKAGSSETRKNMDPKCEGKHENTQTHTWQWGLGVEMAILFHSRRDNSMVVVQHDIQFVDEKIRNPRECRAEQSMRRLLEADSHAWELEVRLFEV